MMKYKNYVAIAEFDDVADIFHGEVINIRDVITFQGKTVKELHKAFENSVDDYLAFCAKRGENPDKPFSGQFVLRLNPEQHRLIAIAAKRESKSLNAWAREHLVAVARAA